MAISMYGYFDKVVFYLSTEDVLCEVHASSRTSVNVRFGNGSGGVSLVLSLQQVRDILDAMRNAGRAAALVDANIGVMRREEEDE